MKGDTIAAIATAMTNAGIGIVRISGEESFSVIDRIYRSKRGDKILSKVPSHTVHYGYIYDEDKMIDEVMVLILKGPNSYTAEDTVEIDCHGGALVTRKVLETVIKYGARVAEPGEFTKRAFINGRIDLSQAESVMDLINAKNDFALESSVHQLHGDVKNKIEKIRKMIIHEIAFIESALDDPEHISIDGYGKKLKNIIMNILFEIKTLLSFSEDGELLKEGINTVIIGKPNAGKSSLMNVLVGKECAIVTDVEGTTRDVLQQQINLNGITLNVVDTAGIRETEDIVEKLGVKKAKEFLLKSDLIIYIVDASTKLDINDEEIIELLSDKKIIILLNKSDLFQVTSEADIKKKMSEKKLYCSILSVSMKDLTGVQELKDMIHSMFLKGSLVFNDEVYITNVRQKAALQSALKSLELVLDSIDNQMPEDFYSIDLMSAYEELGYITGETVGEDLVNEIFSKFCMGK
ncbi:MAG: tRNA uridine-5-carboxymethylaminomethyl(34) synthesis GTPase MnmE [Lachnospiraceae bacterium]|jgi:tRNA modification GTPase|nr:tRNA uridine-5-carboxymethylaminomethyl(34) synthesis GTPase MnmE [Lachnospiraceae bacterium]